MQIKFEPKYLITAKITKYLMRIEAAKEKVTHLPLTPVVLASLRETARLYTTHYSTMIEGNTLLPPEIHELLMHEGHFPGRERDEHEVKGYYAALNQVEQWASQSIKITENIIKIIHELVMTDGKYKVFPSSYRDGQNVIRDGHTKLIVYMPPEAKDISSLMKAMVNWIVENQELPCAIIASIAHYQFATIHPYYDGNGRTARLLTTLILHLGGYDLKGLYSLEEYYARNLGAYYEAITVGDSHNYYFGRADADITKWIEYFLEGMAISFENILKRMAEEDIRGSVDKSSLIRKLNPKQRKILILFQKFEIITSKQIGELFGFKPRTSAQLCSDLVKEGFLEIVDQSNRGRKYRLAKQYENL